MTDTIEFVAITAFSLIGVGFLWWAVRNWRVRAYNKMMANIPAKTRMVKSPSMEELNKQSGEDPISIV